MNEILTKKIRGNSWLFLRRAIRELITHDDRNDNELSKETAVIATTFIQMSFELSIIAYFIKSCGIQGIVNGKAASLDTKAILSKFENNDLQTIPFNKLKERAVKEIGLLRDHIEIIEDFQRMRNKLVHLNYEYRDGDLYDLKYDLIFFLVHIIIPILAEEYSNPSEAISLNLDSKNFKDLLKFPIYANEMHKIAINHSDYVYKCVHCDNESLAVDFPYAYCYSCCDNFIGVGFIDCPYCKSEYSMIYDTLNIDGQPDRTIRGLCLKCDTDDLVYHCDKCDTIIALEGDISEERCYYGFCYWDD